MLKNVFLKTLRDKRKAIFWWAIGITIFLLYICFAYPYIQKSTVDWNEMFAQLPEGLQAAVLGENIDLASAEGFFNAEVFNLALPILLLIFAIGLGSSMILREEEEGTLDLLLSNPITRRRVLIEKYLAMTGLVFILGIVVWACIVLFSKIFGFELGMMRVAAATLSAVLLGLAFGTLALMLGCLTGKRGLSIGVASAIGIASYFINSMSLVIKALEPVRGLSLFYYHVSPDPLRNGFSIKHSLVLFLISAIFLLVSLFAFQRRELKG